MGPLDRQQDHRRGRGDHVESLGRRVSNQPFEFSKYRDAILVIIRLSLGYPLLASVVFTHDAFSNHLNSTPPLGIAGALGLTLMFGLRPHWVAGLVAVWMTYIVVTAIGDKGLYWGLDSAKRELGLLAGAATYGGVR